MGHRQAREVGIFLDSVFTKEGKTAENIKVLASPFLRCVQTANEMLSEFQTTTGNVADTTPILPEYSVFEYDGYNHGYHDSLPSMEERKCYFPRLDETHQSLFVPSLPEGKDAFIERCQKAIEALNKNYPYQGENSAIIIVSHAAGCVALAAAAAGKDITEMNCAGPCCIFRLDRTDNTSQWNIDHHSLKDGMNGYTGHISDSGVHTIPWNHFAKRTKENPSGYSGPP